MTQHSLTTRLEHYINTMLPETHEHQRQAFRDFVAALVVGRTCCQATLARTFANFEAASRRLTRWLHNPRLDPQDQARAHAQAVVVQLPRTGPIRVAIDWTTEEQQHLLVASLLVGRRAVPLYWEAYTTAELKGCQRGLEYAFLDELCGRLLVGLARERLLVTGIGAFVTMGGSRGWRTGAYLSCCACRLMSRSTSTSSGASWAACRCGARPAAGRSGVSGASRASPDGTGWPSRVHAIGKAAGNTGTW